MRIEIAQLFAGFMRSVGICDKLCRFPIPYTYSMHTTRFLLVYVLCLPLAMWPKLGWATVVVAPLATLLLVRASVQDQQLACASCRNKRRGG